MHPLERIRLNLTVNMVNQQKKNTKFFYPSLNAISISVLTRGCQFVLFMQITTFSTCKHKPNLQVKAKKTVCITPKSLLFSIFFFGFYSLNKSIFDTLHLHRTTTNQGIKILSSFNLLSLFAEEGMMQSMAPNHF